MRRWLQLVVLALGLHVAIAAGQNPEVTVDDPFIELRTGPGRGYPIFFIAERGESIAVRRRRTDWFQVEVARGERGWVHLEQMTRTLGRGGERFAVPLLTIEDYAASRWDVGVQYGDFGGANAISLSGGFRLSPNLELELSIGQALGRFSDSTLAAISVSHLMFPERRVTPAFTLGAGTIETSPKATLVATTDRRDSMAHAGVGVRMYLARRFVFRADYKTYVVFTSRDDNEEVREWKAGFSFFF